MSGPLGEDSMPVVRFFVLFASGRPVHCRARVLPLHLQPRSLPCLRHRVDGAVALVSRRSFRGSQTLYAARLLAPGDYGLVSMATLAIGLARMVETSGSMRLLVQDRNIVGEAARAPGRFPARHCTCALRALCAGGAAHCEFFCRAARRPDHHDAEPGVPRRRAPGGAACASLQRELRFARLALVTLVQVVTTSVVLVVAARAGLGYWSLVVNTLAGAVAATVLLIVWEPYALAWPRDLGLLARPFLQGWRILASRIAWYGYTNVDQTLVGRVLGKDALGAYSFAVTFSNIAQQESALSSAASCPASFPRSRNNRASCAATFCCWTEFLAVVIFPCTIGLALTADLVMPCCWAAVERGRDAVAAAFASTPHFLASQTLLSHVLMWTGQFRANMWCTVVAGGDDALVLWFRGRLWFGGDRLGLGDIHADRNHSDVRVRVSHTRTVERWTGSIPSSPRSLRHC